MGRGVMVGMRRDETCPPADASALCALRRPRSNPTVASSSLTEVVMFALLLELLGITKTPELSELHGVEPPPPPR